jgi:hypothetical protein
MVYLSLYRLFRKSFHPIAIYLFDVFRLPQIGHYGLCCYEQIGRIAGEGLAILGRVMFPIGSVGFLDALYKCHTLFFFSMHSL